jgi:predicted DNA-binding protein
MAVFTHRVQAVLTEQQFAALETLAREVGKPISALVRDAVEKTYFEKETLEHRREALQRLLALQAPTDNWPEMEKEIIRGGLP